MDEVYEDDTKPTGGINISHEEVFDSVMQPSKVCWLCNNGFRKQNVGGKYPNIDVLYTAYLENRSQISVAALGVLLAELYNDHIWKIQYADGALDFYQLTPDDVVLHLTKHSIDYTQILLNAICELRVCEEVLKQGLYETEDGVVTVRPKIVGELNKIRGQMSTFAKQLDGRN